MREVSLTCKGCPGTELPCSKRLMHNLYVVYNLVRIDKRGEEMDVRPLGIVYHKFNAVNGV